jgi:release factor glutamine methyltransferase
MAAPAATSTVGDALEGATGAIEAAGVETARLDAELLLCEATGWDRARIAAEPDLRLPVGSSRVFSEMVRRRVRREPVAYIIGRKGFRRIELLVDRRVLIPRPETELLVEEAVSLARERAGEPLTVLDIGTGSGAIALAVADEIPNADVTGIDTSLDALRVAQTNCDRLGLGERVEFVSGGVSSLPLREFDLVLANLPYVSESEWDGLQPEIRNYEPHQALVAGPTGLEVIEALIERFRRHWKPPAVAFEVGAGQAGRVMELLSSASYWPGTRQDLAGVDRTVSAIRVIR